MMEVIYPYESRFKTALKKVKESNISKRNKELILAFNDECFANGLSKPRVTKYIYHLIKLATWLGKDFPNATQEDIKKVVAEIERAQLADSSKSELRMCLKKFYKWMKGSDEYPPEVRWIKVKRKRNSKVKIPEELLTPDEIKGMIESTTNVRDRALVAVLYESGCRIGEILSLKIRNVTFDQHGGILSVPHFCKTGTRRVRIVLSVPYLTEWLNKHPDKDNPEAYLWPGRKSILSHTRARHILVTLAKRAGIKKRIFPHLFRHSRATYLANFLTEAQMKEYFGWVQDSDMASVYVHLSGRDVDRAILKLHGIEREDTQEDQPLSPRPCPRCGKTNPHTNSFCSRCGMPLDEREAVRIIEKEMQRKKADSVLDHLLQDPEFKQMFIRKLEEFGISRV